MCHLILSDAITARIPSAGKFVTLWLARVSVGAAIAVVID